MKIRKLDYILAFLVIFIFYGIQLMAPINVGDVIALFIASSFPAAIIGTISNLIIKSKIGKGQQ